MRTILATISLMIASTSVLAVPTPPPNVCSNPTSCPVRTAPKPPDVGDPFLCPAGSVLIEGDYCPAAVEECIQWVCGDEKPGCAPNKKYPTGRCGEWRKPTRCLTPVANRPHLRFCIDRYEWPNVEGQAPISWLSWYDAKRDLEAAGKRMCTDVEWTFACEGPNMQPYPYGDGYHRDVTACNFDKPIPDVNPPHTPPALRRTRFDVLRSTDKGAEVLNALLVPAGSMQTCVSPFGVFDMVGNIDEFVVNESGHGKPYVSYLKGGHSLGFRNACRPATEAHGPEFTWWETGTRGCNTVPHDPSGTVTLNGR